MKELIKTNLEGKISAKELYQCLHGSLDEYNRWIRQNILENPYAEEPVDFFPSKCDALLSVRFARRLCMSSQVKHKDEIIILYSR